MMFVHIIYDSIHNSVFEGQVLEPLIQHYAKHKAPILLISFEKNPIDKTILETIPPYITTIIIKKFPYAGKTSLYPAILKLKRELAKLPLYQLRARGPLAGFIAAQAATPSCTQLCIQARGLLAEEYSYEHAHHGRLYTYLHTLRRKLYHNLEQSVYTLPFKTSFPVHIEAVSCALKQYLVATYGLDPERISVAQHDIPPSISAAQKQQWRKEIRTLLTLEETITVYCYNGSAHTWQCPAQTVQFFTTVLHHHPRSFLLILSKDRIIFEQIAQQYRLEKHTYRIVSVHHHDIYRYLAACDIGIIFRQPHVLNWISRPTKALEYQAVGLRIIHNNTVEMLCARK